MAINKNHEFEDIDSQRYAIVEKNASGTRSEFLKHLLEFNGYTVVVNESAPPKAATVTPDTQTLVESTGPKTFTVSVTDVVFNATNAIFGRMLRAPNGNIVTQSYWLQKESESHDEVPYYEKKL